MTSETPDMLYPIAVEEKELEMLIIALIQTLKRWNKKCGNEEVFNLVKDSVDGVIKKEVFNNFLERGTHFRFDVIKMLKKISLAVLTEVET